MRITKLVLPEGVFNLGLKDQTLDRLGKIVVLAGRNGSGKTRILSAVTNWNSGGPGHSVHLDEVASMLENDVADLRGRLAQERNPEKQRVLKGFLGMDERKAKEGRARANAMRGTKVERESSSEMVVSYTRRPLDLSNPKNSSPIKLEQRAEELRRQDPRDRRLGMSFVVDAAFPYLMQLSKRGMLADNDALPIDDDDRHRDRESLRSLDDLLKDLLGTQLGRDRDGDPTLFGRPLGDAALSEGQEYLLGLAVALHAQGSQLGSQILLLDEPENHLHPDALLDVLDRLNRLITDGQIWIATHSVHVLAWAPPDSLWYMDDGRATWAGKTPEKVLAGLLGGDARRAELEQFLQLPAQLAATRFAAQCLQPPDVVATGPTDAQLMQVRQAMIRLRPEGRPLTVLDFGAGRARLLPALCEEVGGQAVEAVVDYRAFDLDPRYIVDRERAVMQAYGALSPPNRIYDRMDALQADLKGKVDLVVLCNVLHEIDPSEWLRVFRDLRALLRSDGHLLVVEDYQLPVGENAHRYGFLLLDEPQVKQLFAWSEEDGPFVTSGVRGGRLKAHLVPAALLDRASAGTRRDALRSLKERAEHELKRLREAPSSHADGRLFAMWGQLYANASLALAGEG